MDDKGSELVDLILPYCNVDVANALEDTAVHCATHSLYTHGRIIIRINAVNSCLLNTCTAPPTRAHSFIENPNDNGRNGITYLVDNHEYDNRS